MARLKEIVIDCDAPSRLACFWTRVHDGYEVLPYDDAELARLAAQRLTPETDPSVMVEGPGPRSCFHLTGASARPRSGCTSTWPRRTATPRSPDSWLRARPWRASGAATRS